VTFDRRYVLGAVFGLLALGAAAMLADVLATVFFAVTVAYLLSPLREELTERGLSSWRASLVATATGVVAVVALALPLVLVVGVRIDAIIAFLSSLPPTLTVDFYGFSTTITLAEARSTAVAYGRQLARSFALVVPVLALKLTVFVMVVFALLSRTDETHRALLALVPHSYRDVVRALSGRTRATLFAIYVLQAATAAGTFVVTEEVWTLAADMAWIQTLATVAIVFGIGYGALYKADDRDPEAETEVGGVPLRFVSLILVSYCSVLTLALAFGAPGTFLADTGGGRSVGVGGVRVAIRTVEVTIKAVSVGAVFSVVGAATADSLF